MSLGAPEESSTPKQPPSITSKPAPQRRDLSIHGQTLELSGNSNSAAPELSSSRQLGLSRQDAIDLEDQEEVDEPNPPQPAACTQDIIDAVAENTLQVTMFISDLADRVKDLESSVNKTH